MQWKYWIIGGLWWCSACGQPSAEEQLIAEMCDCYTPVMEQQQILFDSVKDSLPEAQVNANVEQLMMARMEMNTCIEQLAPLRKQVNMSDSLLAETMKEKCPAVVAFYEGLAKNPID